MSPSPGAEFSFKFSTMVRVRMKFHQLLVVVGLVLVAGPLGLAQVREEDQAGTMRNTMNDLNKLNSEGKPKQLIIYKMLVKLCFIN